MPKAQPPKTLNRKDFVYLPVHSKTAVTQNRASAKTSQENGSSGAQTPDIVAQEALPQKPNSTAADATTTHQVYFPRIDNKRQTYRTKSGKKLTQYQWDIYDFLLKVPKGNVTTYKIVSQSVGGSARSVGGALRVNPFNPYVPCHRVVASNLYIGGFFGQWAGRKTARASKDSQPNEGDPLEVQSKIALLKGEGVSVDNRGFLVDAGGLVWKPAEDM